MSLSNLFTWKNAAIAVGAVAAIAGAVYVYRNSESVDADKLADLVEEVSEKVE